ncbi:MAG: SCP2 sterol-binding domain-containing protein [Nitrospirota bacterium]
MKELMTMSVDVKRYLAQIRKINEKVNLDEEFPDWNKSVQFIIKNSTETAFYFVVDGGKVSKVEQGKLDKADVIIEGKPEAMQRLFDGEIPIIGAFITKELTITGPIGDAIGAKVLLEAARIF